MPNDYFKLKQFTVNQGNCAMKVCTDACLFGAWVASTINNKKFNPENILDIGAGTGLLSLMLAQKTTALISAIEIDEAAAIQTRQNFQASPWNDRLKIYNQSIQSFNALHKFDLVISNPPFYNNALQSADEKRNLALHTTSLSYHDLISSANNLLSENGLFAVLLPFSNAAAFIELADKLHIYLINRTNVKQTTAHSFFRSMMLFSKKQQPLQTNEISIKENNNYTADFVELLKVYYLYLNN